MLGGGITGHGPVAAGRNTNFVTSNGKQLPVCPKMHGPEAVCLKNSQIDPIFDAEFENATQNPPKRRFRAFCRGLRPRTLDPPPPGPQSAANKCPQTAGSSHGPPGGNSGQNSENAMGGSKRGARGPSVQCWGGVAEGCWLAASQAAGRGPVAAGRKTKIM